MGQTFKHSATLNFGIDLDRYTSLNNIIKKSARELYLEMRSSCKISPAVQRRVNMLTSMTYQHIRSQNDN